VLSQFRAAEQSLSLRNTRKSSLITFGEVLLEVLVMTEKPLKPCDLVMKGGVTSGIVYPAVIERLARERRLHSIGGTSAGAIGAVMAAAAEYRRQTSSTAGDHVGFAALKGLAEELG